MFIVTFVLYENEGSDRAEALRYWRETHGPIAAKIPGLMRYVQQHAVAAPDGVPPFLGVGPAWRSPIRPRSRQQQPRRSSRRRWPTCPTSPIQSGCPPPSSMKSPSSAEPDQQPLRGMAPHQGAFLEEEQHHDGKAQRTRLGPLRRRPWGGAARRGRGSVDGRERRGGGDLFGRRPRARTHAGVGPGSACDAGGGPAGERLRPHPRRHRRAPAVA